MILIFFLGIYCFLDTLLYLQFRTRLRPSHFSLSPSNFWSSGKKTALLFLAICTIIGAFPFLAIPCILFTKWPHPLLIAWRDFKDKKPLASFPISKKTLGHKLFSIPTDDQPHLIFVVLESFRAKNVGSLGAKNGLSPHFDKLAKEGVLFTQFHSTGNLTNRSIIASQFGIPAAHKPWHLGHYSDLSLIGLPEILSRHGYHPALIQGGSLAFDHEAEFFQKHGFQTIFGKRDISKPGNSWGVYDEHLMPFAASWLEKQTTPVYLNLMTITNHHPWIPPEGPSGYLNTFSYTDKALGGLIEELEKRSLLEKSILFVFGDHGQELEDRDPYYEINRHLYQDNVHVPLLIYAKGRTSAKTIDTLASQIDLLPTVLDLMNLSDTHHSLGKSLLRPSTSPIYFSHPFDAPIRGCRSGNWKYLIQDSHEELYDLSKDSGEKQNKIAVGPSLKEQTLSYFDKLDTFYSGRSIDHKEITLHLEFINSLITDDELEKTAKSHPDLVSISLKHCLLLSDRGIASLLKHCQKLEKLQIEGVDEITALNWGEAPHLIHLKIANCPNISPKWINKIPSLQILSLCSLPINDGELIELNLKNLVSLQIESLYQISDQGFKPLLEQNPELSILTLIDCPEITKESLDAIQVKPLRYQLIADCMRISDLPITPCQ